MRTTVLLVFTVTLALSGCWKAPSSHAEKSTNSVTNAAAPQESHSGEIASSSTDLPSAAPQAVHTPVPQPDDDPFGPSEPNPPAKPGSPNAGGLLAQIARFGGYHQRWGADDDGPYVVQIQFRGPGPKDADLEGLRPLLLSSLDPLGLSLGGCESITDGGLAHLKGIGTLRRLSLDNKKLTDEALKHISSLNNLEELFLSNDSITDAGLVHLSNLVGLRKLSIYSKGVTEAGYVHLAGLVNLVEMNVGEIGFDHGDESLRHIKGLTKLKELSVGDKVTDAGMAHLAHLTDLQKLRIDCPKATAAGIAHLAPLKKLQTLTATGGPFSGDALAALKDMSELRELELVYGSVDRTGGMHIGKLTGLKKLWLGGVQNGTLEGIAGLKTLEHLNLHFSGLDDDNMQYLSGLTGLQFLDVQHNKVTDAGLKHLAGLPNLRELFAGNSDITDAGLAHLAQVPNLEVVFLDECKITGSGFKELTRLASLKELRVNGSPVVDDHVMALKDVPELKEVYLTGTKVSDERALALKQARPEMRILDASGNGVTMDAKPTPRRASPVEDISKVAPAFRLTAGEYHKEYEDGENAAAEKYGGKVIELSGEVDNIGRNISGDSFVTLKVENELIGVMCATVDEQPWAKVVPGQKIRIKGKWPEFSISAALIYCVFLETGEYAGIRITAADLAKEYAADSEATVKKYDDKHLVLTGEVVAKQYNSAGAASVVLKTGNQVKVTCGFTAFENDVTKPIKVGQTITVVGEFTLNFGGGDEVDLRFCLPLATP